jgi:hypothetical protein
MSKHTAVQNMHNMVQYWTSIQPTQNTKRSVEQVVTTRRKVKIKRSLPKTPDVSHTNASGCSKS